MKCPKCKRGHLVQHVEVFIECPFETTDLSKRGIKRKDVKIIGANWPLARIFCERCGHMMFNGLKGARDGTAR